MLVGCLNRSVEVRLMVMKYEGFLPFIAQACSWMISRDDIVTESKWLQLDFPMTTTCMEAQKVLSFIIRDFDDVDMFRGLLKRIASTPLLSNDPDCNDSIIVGLVRTLKIEPQQKHRFIEEHHDWLKHIIETLLLAEHVDARVIAELIKCGRQSSSIESSKFVMRMILDIMIWSDSRFAVAIRNGFAEFCIHNASTGDHLEIFAKGLYTMAMHKKTARALRGKRPEIISALDVLKNKSPSQHDRISPLINDSLDFGTSICCNCLKEFDRKDLRFCANCNVECYCSVSCQSESWGAGHSGCCKNITNEFEDLIRQGVGNSDIKRFSTLASNLMMAGCRFVQKNMLEILKLSIKEEDHDILGKGVTVVIDYQHHPPSIELTRNDTDEKSGSMKCSFISPVLYGFTEKVGHEQIVVLDKFIPDLLGHLTKLNFPESLTSEILD